MTTTAALLVIAAVYVCWFVILWFVMWLFGE